MADKGPFPQNGGEGNNIEAQMSIPSVLLLLSLFFQINGIKLLRFNKQKKPYSATLLSLLLSEKGARFLRKVNVLLLF